MTAPRSLEPCASTIASIAAHMRLVEGEIDRKQRRGLQVDAAAPAFAHGGEHRPTDCGLRPDAVDMRADRARAVRIGAAQAELHAPRDVGGAPIGVAVGGDGVQRGGETSRRDWRRAARCGPCRDGCARRRKAAARCGRRGRRRGSIAPAPRRPPARSRAMRPSSIDDIDFGKAFAVERRRWRLPGGGTILRVDDSVARALGEREVSAHASRPRALSCQRRSSR